MLTWGFRIGSDPKTQNSVSDWSVILWVPGAEYPRSEKVQNLCNYTNSEPFPISKSYGPIDTGVHRLLSEVESLMLLTWDLGRWELNVAHLGFWNLTTPESVGGSDGLKIVQ